MATKTTIPGYVRLERAAEILGVDHSTVFRYVTDQRIDALKIGNTHLIREDDLRAFERPRMGRPPKNNRPNHGEKRNSRKSRRTA